MAKILLALALLVSVAPQAGGPAPDPCKPPCAVR